MKRIDGENLIGLFEELFTPWRSQEGTIYVNTKEGETLPLYDPKIMGLIVKHNPNIFWSDRTFKEAQGYMHAKAFSNPPQEVALRVAKKGDALFYDGGDFIIKFEGGKWTKVPQGEAPRFVRGQGMLPQVEPLQGAPDFVDQLAAFLPTLPKETLLLLTAWLVGCYQVGGPYPILMMHGEQGSAKSTTTRLLRRLIDPHALDMRDPNIDERGFIAAAKNSFVLAFDNVSYMPHKMSDLLCRVATGTAALGARQLYTDHAEAAFTVLRPTILNGIPEMTQREDFASRTIAIQLPTIPDALRRDDPEFWATFEATRGSLVGALFDLVAKAHHERDVLPLVERPRLIGFLQWASACFETRRRTLFLETFKANARDAEIALLEQDLFLQGVIGMMQEKKGFVGTVFELQNALVSHIPMGFTRDHLPNTPKGVHERLKRAIPILRGSGITYHKGSREGGSGRRQIVLGWTKEAVLNNFQVSVTQ